MKFNLHLTIFSCCRKQSQPAGAKHRPTKQEEETVKEQYAEVKMQLTTKRKKQEENIGDCLIDSSALVLF